MKRLCVLLFMFIVFPLIVQAEDLEPDELFECPQCGLWWVSGSNIPALAGDRIFVDDEEIVIPGCGTFGYTAKKSVEKRERARFYNYKISMSLKQKTGFFLCEKKEGDDWRLQLEVSGADQEGGFANFTLRRNETDDPVLEFTNGWNMQRGSPCDIGSGSASISCG